jgi:hypothetical protein
MSCINLSVRIVTKFPKVEPLIIYSPSLTAMSMSPETQNMKLKRNMVYFTQEEMYVNPLGIRRLALTPALLHYKIVLGKLKIKKFLICVATTDN